MQVSELNEVVTWVDENIRVSGLLSLYQGLHAVVNQNAQRRNNQQAVPFETQKQQLFDALNNIDVNELNLSQLSVLERLEIDGLVGPKAVEKIEDILSRNTIDVVTAASQINELVQKLNNGLNLVNQLVAPLNKIVVENVDEDSVKKNEALMRVHFQWDSSIRNVDEFKQWGAKWNTISYGFTRALGKTNTDMRITGASKGSVILELVSDTAVIAMIGGGIKWTLDAIKTGLEIRHQVKATENLQVDTKLKEQMIALLDESMKNHKKSSIETITEQLIADNKLNENGDKGDIYAALKQSVKELYEFVDGGGEVDFSPHKEQEKEEQLALLKNHANKAREISSEIRAIEFKTNLGNEEKETE
ncbi:hypothetical protein OPW19_21450 [Vibrio europaeus]|uniref:hypothetical protein n=1 Tax=Vibrio europaeus TaxID=300876 RepID=UPI00233EFC98|nr:hypothetical protein [Vibrio europaeus]MDC5822388.1 hypothetical protein [Vibrio europaeus]